LQALSQVLSTVKLHIKTDQIMHQVSQNLRDIKLLDACFNDILIWLFRGHLNPHPFGLGEYNFSFLERLASTRFLGRQLLK